MAQTIQTLALNVRLSCQLLDVPESSYYERINRHDLEKLYKDMLNLTYRTEDEDSIRYFVLFTGFEINKTKKGSVAKF